MNILNYLILSFRSWLKTPVEFTLSILMLAVGIGASVAAYGFLDAALLRPLPVKNPHEIMRISNSLFGTIPSGHYYDLKDYSSVLADSFISRTRWGTSFQSGDTAVLVSASEVSGNYFEVLGISAKLGRTVRLDDDVSGAAPVVVISERFWRKEFNAQDEIIGSLIRLDGRSATVVGVIPEPFRGTFRMSEVDVWFPYRQFLAKGDAPQRGGYSHTVQFRLRDGVKPSQVQADLDAFAAHVSRDPLTYSGYYLTLLPEREAILERHRDLANQSFFILAVLLSLLLIGCANVSNVLLAKVNDRRSELAVRRALGAPARSIFGLLISDGLLLSALAGLTGILFSFLFVKAFSLLGMELSPREAMSIRLLIFFISVVFLVGFLCAVIPAIQAVRANINEVLKESSRTSTRFRTGGALIVLQVAFSIILLIGAGLFARSFHEAQRVSPGFRMESLLSFTLNLSNLGDTRDDERVALYRRLLEELEGHPGVVSAGISTYRPFQEWLSSTAGIWRSGLDIPDNSPFWASSFFIVGPGFFKTMDIPILRGREAMIEDVEDGDVAVVNEAFAEHFFPGENPIGREFYPITTNRVASFRIIGVSRNFQHGIRQVTPPVFMHVRTDIRLVMMVHTEGPPERLKPAILSMVREVEPTLPVQDLMTVEESRAKAIQPIRAGSSITALVGVLGLAISLIGIYAALSYWVRRSSQEIGLRMALGASPGTIVKLYVRRGALIVSGGLVLGLALAAFLMPYVQDLLYQVDARDPATFLAVPIVLFVAAILASYFSARHAARVDPMVALRRE